jgi:hypothetical protein
MEVGVEVVAVVKAMDLLLQCGDLMTKINRGIKKFYISALSSRG